MRIVTMIDPPSGWQYGFPKVLPNNQLHRVNEWLVEQGYPQKIIDEFDGRLPCRYWESNSSDDINLR